MEEEGGKVQVIVRDTDKLRTQEDDASDSLGTGGPGASEDRELWIGTSCMVRTVPPDQAYAHVASPPNTKPTFQEGCPA